MCYVHVAHDCVVGDNIVMANNTAIAWHVHIGNGAILGGGTLVHQFCRIGQFVMTAAGTTVLQDIPALLRVQGIGQSAWYEYRGYASVVLIVM